MMGRSRLPNHFTQHVETVSAFDVRAELDRILKSRPFRNSERLQGFLKFALECALEGDQLKESIIGRAVYDRGSNYDPRQTRSCGWNHSGCDEGSVTTMRSKDGGTRFPSFSRPEAGIYLSSAADIRRRKMAASRTGSGSRATKDALSSSSCLSGRGPLGRSVGACAVVSNRLSGPARPRRARRLLGASEP